MHRCALVIGPGRRQQFEMQIELAAYLFDVVWAICDNVTCGGGGAVFSVCVQTCCKSVQWKCKKKLDEKIMSRSQSLNQAYRRMLSTFFYLTSCERNFWLVALTVSSIQNIPVFSNLTADSMLGRLISSRWYPVRQQQNASLTYPRTDRGTFELRIYESSPSPACLMCQQLTKSTKDRREDKWALWLLTCRLHRRWAFTLSVDLNLNMLNFIFLQTNKLKI